ncbi:MAG: serine/threonine protein kinase [Deltaproteobacteria bacterium]|jgi:serine/threonine-protein kinase|nr:serine/threonine protein kinase [Deltaproteobacteria bacterium]MBW2531624.1 serine/threonine protein kinase [Deltaproteobacteria bacterium]
MTEPAKLLLRKAESDRSPAASMTATGELPAEFVRSATRRLQVVAFAMGLGVLLLSLVVPALSGTLANELSSVDQWLPDLLNVAASFSVFFLARGERLTPGALINLALVYEVCAAAFVALACYTGFEWALSVWDDRFGFFQPGWVAVWMMFFAILVPARPAKALLASLGAAAAVPTVVAIAMSRGDAPALPAKTFFTVWVLPYLIVTATAFFANLVLYRLGRCIRRAQELGSYQLEERLGQGGMGEVWRARHRMLARPAAIKLIRSEALGSRGPSETAMERFCHEAEATAALQSPHTVELYDFGTSDDGRLYYVMELLDGIDLDSLVDRHGPVPEERVVHVLLQACSSLAEAHARGLVHRDIKPANIVLTTFALEHDFVKVLDFGLVKQQAELDGEASGLSQTGVVTGTPGYIAPELALDEEVDGRADIYALGCVAYWLLTGRLVFEAATPMKQVVAHVTTEPEPPSAHTDGPITPALEQLVLECLAKKPAARPSSAKELAARLAALNLPSSWTAERAAQWWAEHEPGPARANTLETSHE